MRTNNVAEYVGVVRALALALELGATEVDLLLDSKLIVEQVNGRWRVKDVKIAPLYAEVRASSPGSGAGRPATCRAPRTRPPTDWPTRRSIGSGPVGHPSSSAGRIGPRRS